MKTTDYRTAAQTLWGQAGAYAHDTYQRLLPLYPGLPKQLPIVIGITAYGRCLGLTRIPWTHGARITIASNQFKQGTRRVDDIMAHEMAHAWLHHQELPTEHKHQPWYDAVQRLSPAILGHELPLTHGAHRKSVRITTSDGHSTVRKIPNTDATPHHLVARWPMAFRPADYDWGEPIQVPTY